jgi:hypothetical protein
MKQGPGPTTTAPNGKGREKLDPEHAFAALRSRFHSLEQEDRQADQKMHEAEQLLAMARELKEHVNDKKQTLYASIEGNPGLTHKLDAKPFDPTLMKLLKKNKHGGWVKMQREGATDDRILLQLKQGYESWGSHLNGNSPAAIYGGNDPYVQIDAMKLKGAELVGNVRRVLSIPQPMRNSASAAAARASGAGAAGATPAAAKKAPKKKGAPQTKKAEGGVKPGTVVQAADVGVTREQLEAAMPPADRGGLFGNMVSKPGGGGTNYEAVGGGWIGKPLQLAGGDFAVTLAHEGSGTTTYDLHPVFDLDEWEGPQEDWARRRSRFKGKPPEETPLTHVVVQTPTGKRYVLGLDGAGFSVVAPRPAQQPQMLADVDASPSVGVLKKPNGKHPHAAPGEWVNIADAGAPTSATPAN